MTDDMLDIKRFVHSWRTPVTYDENNSIPLEEWYAIRRFLKMVNRKLSDGVYEYAFEKSTGRLVRKKISTFGHLARIYHIDEKI